MDRLRKRAEFLAAAKGRKFTTASFVLQALPRNDQAPPRLGLTVSKRVGNAVERNRVRRRLREMARLTAQQTAKPAMFVGHDYVLVGRRAALKQTLERMQADFLRALREIHEPRRNSARNAAHETTS